MGWNDIKAGKNNNSTSDKKEVKWANLSAGTHQFRILDDEPYSRWTHWVQSANAGKGATIECIGRECPICIARKTDDGKKRFSCRKQHALNAIQRKLGNDGKPIPGDVGEVVIIDKGNGLFEALDNIMDEVGDLRGYDIKIRVSGSGKDTSYTPIPLAAKPLTEAEKTLERYDFATIFSSFTPEQISALMNGATYKDILGTNDDNNNDSDTTNLNVDFTQK